MAHNLEQSLAAPEIGVLSARHGPSACSVHFVRRAALIVQVLCAACGTDSTAATAPTPAPPSAPAPSSGVVSGLVTDTRGRPIAGAKVVINNALWFNRNVVLKSGADGSYRYALPATDAWYVRGTTTVSYHGRTYEIELKPDYSASFPGTEGRVVNLRWTMTGEVSKDFGAGGYYGGTVQMDADIGMFDVDGVVLTLTPVGPLLDGSEGRVISHKVVGTRGFIELFDIPMGRYTVRATLDDVSLSIRMRGASASASTQTMDFEPAYTGATVYGLYFYVSPTD
jgi:hypothetical protein